MIIHTFGNNSSDSFVSVLSDYDGVHLKRTKDGVSIFWKKEDWNLVEQYDILYDPITDSIIQDELFYTSPANRNGLIVELQSIKFPKQNIIIATTHLEWNPRFEDNLNC